MFSIQRRSENGFNKIILKDESSNTTAEILPECGAILHAFRVTVGEQSPNIISSYLSMQEFRENPGGAGFRGSKLSPFVCRIKNATYSFAGTQYVIEKYRLGNDAIHGVLFDRPFEVIGETANESHASVTMRYRYGQEDPGYPFVYDCIVTWQLNSDNRLTVTTECINRDKGLIPMQDGWHPYFTFGEKIDDLQLEFQSMELVEFKDLIPTGKTSEYDKFNSLKPIGEEFFDNCFTLNLETCQPMCVLRSSSKGIQIEISPERSYPYLQVYTPHHRNSIAIENLSGAPDGFNNGMGVQTLEPGQSARYEVAYKIVILEKNHE